ncbi:MAG: PrgI family protein [Patescibacteria group bacterium]
MQYQVPQFIEIEDKIFGPLTFKQFVYVAGAGGMCYLAYRFIPSPISFLIVLPLGAFGLALAFYKVNNRPFISVVESAVRYSLGYKLYLWKKKERAPTAEETAELPLGAIYVPKLSDSKLKDLTWSLDINETIYSKNQKGLQSRQEVDALRPFEGLPQNLTERQNIYEREQRNNQ